MHRSIAQSTERGRNHCHPRADIAPDAWRQARCRAVHRGVRWRCTRSANTSVESGRPAAAPGRRWIDTPRSGPAEGDAARTSRMRRSWWARLLHSSRAHVLRAGKHAVERRGQLRPASPRTRQPRHDDRVGRRRQRREADGERLSQATSNAVAHHGIADATTHRDPDARAAELIGRDVDHQQWVRPASPRDIADTPEIGWRAQPLLAVHPGGGWRSQGAAVCVSERGRQFHDTREPLRPRS